MKTDLFKNPMILKHLKRMNQLSPKNNLIKQLRTGLKNSWESKKKRKKENLKRKKGRGSNWKCLDKTSSISYQKQKLKQKNKRKKKREQLLWIIREQVEVVEE